MLQQEKRRVSDVRSVDVVMVQYFWVSGVTILDCTEEIGGDGLQRCVSAKVLIGGLTTQEATTVHVNHTGSMSIRVIRFCCFIIRIDKAVSGRPPDTSSCCNHQCPP